MRILLVLTAWLATAVIASAELTPAFTPTDLDPAQCLAYAGNKPLGPAPPAVLEGLLGLRAAAPAGAWSTGKTNEMKRYFRVAFTRPVTIGTICTSYTGAGTVYWFGVNLDRTVSYLKADAPYPGDVTRDEQWVILPPGPVKALPPGTSTRALRFAEIFPTPVATPSPDQYQTPASSMGPALCFKERYYNAAILGVQKSIPGKMRESIVLTPPVWLGFWRDPLPVAGFVILHGRASMTPTLQVEYLLPDRTEFAPTAPPAAWRRLPDCAGLDKQAAFVFGDRVTTRSLRITPLEKYGGQFEYSLGGPLYALAPLDENADPPRLSLPVPPFKLAFTMPMDGRAAIAICDKATGRQVRRLVAEGDRPAGNILEPWDLKDNAGQYVPPGEYLWKGLACPPLKLTYELTVNNAGQPPWWAPVRGGGSWMADHSAPMCVGAVGKTMLLGSMVCEKGQAAIATDLDGNKLWGESPVLTGWGGGYRIASDGRYGYIVNHYGIQRVDPQQPDFAPTEVFKFTWTPEVPGPAFGGDYLGGTAARGDKLYIAYNTPPTPWIQSAIIDGIDAGSCQPPVVNAPKCPEYEYDNVTRLHSVFSMVAPSNNRAVYGDALNGTLTVAFRKPSPVGSVLVPDAAIRVYALKPGQTLTVEEPDVEDKDVLDTEELVDPAKWVPLTTTGTPGAPGLAVIPKGMQTKALRFQAKRLTYALVLNRRFADAAPEAERVPLEGTVTPHGGWKVEREPAIPMNADNPAQMGLIWKAPVTLRGVSFSYPTTASMAIDTFTGADADDPKAALADDAKWKQVGYIQIEIFSGYWPQIGAARHVDFAGPVRTRALRFRAVSPARYLNVVDPAQLAKLPQLAGFDAVVAYVHLGKDDPELPPCYNERVTEFKLPQGAGKVEVLRHLPLAKPGYLAFNKDGVLYAISDGRLVTMPLDGGEPKPALPAGMLEKPLGFTFDADGLLYIVDQGPSVVKVIDVKAGTLVRTIGTPGGMKVGPWDGLRFDSPVDVAIDANGKLWVVEQSMLPKRVSRWTRDGTLEKSFLGPTSYGGGGVLGGAGVLDAKNHALMYFDGMKFAIDWATRTWKLDSIVYRPGVNGPAGSAATNRPVYYQGRRYLVSDPGKDHGIAVVCEEKAGIAVPLAAAGPLAAWTNLNRFPGFRQAFARLAREKYGFLWVDENRDGIPQVAEVKITNKSTLGPGYWASGTGEDLSLNFNGARIPLQSIRADGLPLYDLEKLQILPLLGGPSTWTTADGYTFVLGGDYLLAPDGVTKVWEYPDPAAGVQRSYPVPFPRPAGALIAEFGVMGHITVGKEEYFATNNNYGDWYLFSRDGLLATWIFGGPAGHGRRHWTMPECEPGKTDLSEVRLDAEDFFGSIVAAEDGKVYLSAGGNHNSLVRVDGLEAVKRLNGTVTVTPADLEKAKAWETERIAFERQLQEPKIGSVPYVDPGSIAADGSLAEWPAPLFLPVMEHWDEQNERNVIDAQAALAFNEDMLYIAAQVADRSPLMNNGGDSKELFKHGDAVDVALGVDPKAPDDRTLPVAGDLRLLITQVKGKPVVVVYRPVAPDAPRDKRVRYYTPAGGEVWMDVVGVIEDATVGVWKDLNSWTLEAAIPWKSLGVAAPPIKSKLRGDVGVILSDDNGMRTVQRAYWAGKTQTTVADVPTEARLQPSLWGELNYLEQSGAIKFGPVEPGDALLP